MVPFFSLAEAKRYLRIGMPIFVAQLSQTGMNFADTAMTGHYNSEDMAAVAVAGSVWAPVALLGVGCLMALPPLSAQMVGAGNREGCAHLLRQGIWLTIFIGALLIAFFWQVSYSLEFFGVNPQMAELGGGYMRALLWGTPAFMFFVNQRAFFEGFARTKPAMIVGVIGLALNVPCNYVLIYGKFGFPEMGAVGCGVASSVCYWFMALAMTVWLRKDPRYADLRPLFTPFRRRYNNGEREKVFDLKLVLRVLRIGFPSAIALFFEVSLFAVSALILAPLGTTVVAANQIALNFAGILFMIPLAIGMTGTIRVGFCLGSRDLAQTRVATLTGLTIALVFSLFISGFTILLREPIAHIYSFEPAVVEMSKGLIFYLAAYQVLDAAQMMGIAVLRGYNDTRIISLICFCAYWCVGLPIGYVLSRTDLLVPSLGAAGFWIAYLFALGFGAVCYWARVRYLHSLPAAEIYARVSK